MKLSKGCFLLFTISVLLISACSSTQQAYLQNVEMYFDNDIDISLSDDEVRQSPVDLVYVRNGDRPIATMALAFIEEGRYKWLSKDKAMFITENGRLVRTHGLEHNLIYVSNLSADPLKSLSEGNDLSSWTRVIDTEHQDYGVELSSLFSATSDEIISIHSHNFKVSKYVESINYHSAKHSNASWINTYWIHQASGQLLKSTQKVSALSETVEITYVSRALRLVEQ
ncbi:YjbF family lipoprotein [Aliiglaciecola litoralis]|uniref:YjbF family lipoprotein n=1 Tax=Aliiglaciecola litoralis TaxID=582857 RepID=A0ABP3WSF7_9ALTE